MTTPRRRWSFSLRTLFIVVTAIGFGLGWQLRIVGARKAAVDELRAADVRVEYRQESDSYGRLPLIRRLLGDRSVGEVAYPVDSDQGLVQLAKRMLPECWITIDSTRPKGEWYRDRRKGEKPEMFVD